MYDLIFDTARRDSTRHFQQSVIIVMFGIVVKHYYYDLNNIHQWYTNTQKYGSGFGRTHIPAGFGTSSDVRDWHDLRLLPTLPTYDVCINRVHDVLQ